MEWSEQEAALLEKRELKKSFDGEKLSDHELLELIQDRVNRSPYLTSGEIKVSVIKGKIFLSGNVSTQANKLRLSELVESMPSVKEIHNSIEVTSDEPERIQKKKKS
jgi:osmotically-inducible protein OsmY